ncbi:unnamed protein product [Closterium sp. NIES-54]
MRPSGGLDQHPQTPGAPRTTDEAAGAKGSHESAATAGVPAAQLRLYQLHLRRRRLRLLHPSRHRHRRLHLPRSPDPHDQGHECRTRGHWRDLSSHRRTCGGSRRSQRTACGPHGSRACGDSGEQPL